MKVIILAAGYATRLYPLTRDRPKPLIEVGGKTILDHLVDQLRTIDDLDGAVLVTNSKFADHFRRWRDEASSAARADGRAHLGMRFDVLDDGTTSNDDRLGGVGDLRYALDHADIDDDVLVLGADRILLWPLAEFVAAHARNPAAYICVYDNPDVEDRKRRGNAVLDSDNRILEFVEKPSEPRSNWSVPPFYIYPRESQALIGEYLDGGGNPDAPGYYVQWLHTRVPVFAHIITGDMLDIGNPESLAEARRIMDKPS